MLKILQLLTLPQNMHRAARHHFGWLRIGAALPLVFILGCTQSGRPIAGNPVNRQVSEPQELELQVRNLNFNQVTIYTARGGSILRRLGTVQGKGEETFTFAWHLPDIQLRFKYLAGPDRWTRSIPVMPGERLLLEVPIR